MRLRIKIEPGERVNDFCERFDNIIRDYEAYSDGVPITQAEKRAAFYQAVVGLYPDVTKVDVSKRVFGEPEITMETMRTLMFQLEENLRGSRGEPSKEQRPIESLEHRRKKASVRKMMRTTAIVAMILAIDNESAH